MARVAENDGVINRLNEISHYVGTVDFQWLLGARPPVAPQQAAQRKESFMLKLVWLRDRVRQMPPTDNPETLRQYARCYIMILIGGYLMTDKLNNLVHLRWLPLLVDFGQCRALSWGSAVLAWTCQSQCLAAHRGITDIANCTPLLMSWIYQRFFQWCPPDRGIYMYPTAARLVGLQQQSRDQHESRVLRWRVLIDRLRFDEALFPPWFDKEEEWGTWMSVAPLSTSILCSFTRFLTSTGRGENVWWPDRHSDWHLSGEEVLEDLRLAELPADVQPTASQLRDDLHLPRGVPDRCRHARNVRANTQRPARRDRGARERKPDKGVRRERVRPRRARLDIESDEEAEFDCQEDYGDIPSNREDSPLVLPPPPPAAHALHPPSGSRGPQHRAIWDTSPPSWHDAGTSEGADG
ncbi:hypothetical protein Ahy_B02g058415 [Arachis hypogaea]|uniref:Aminotransferase-like plant mobile domain-containing protein n=1 Tax=Arachis hypogaea TaxID=3818 RepID=A0A445AEM8_ARAHY|nr:hypothetical protein Ahy_B02g058415 [Arachis hypogaea]